MPHEPLPSDKAPLSPAEREMLAHALREGHPLPREYLERLFPLALDGEFFWPGKYSPAPSPDPAGSIPIHSQTADSEGWHNRLFHADNLLLLPRLIHGPLTDNIARLGGVRLIYCDPPFAVGTDFHVIAGKAPSGSGNGPSAPTPHKQPLAFHDHWNCMGEYYSMLAPRLALMRDLLADNGILALHCDWRAVAGLRHILDEIFGQKQFVNALVWHYTGGGRSKRYFSRKHDSILIYAKGKHWVFNADAVRIPYAPTSGYAKSGIVSRAGKRYLPNPKGAIPDDVWSIPMINPMAGERQPYATQKPLPLLDRLIKAFTNPGDIVADFFCGSGTTAHAATLANRRWLACDKGAIAVDVCVKRLDLKEENELYL